MIIYYARQKYSLYTIQALHQEIRVCDIIQVYYIRNWIKTWSLTLFEFSNRFNFVCFFAFHPQLIAQQLRCLLVARLWFEVKIWRNARVFFYYKVLLQWFAIFDLNKDGSACLKYLFISKVNNINNQRSWKKINLTFLLCISTLFYLIILFPIMFEDYYPLELKNFF